MNRAAIIKIVGLLVIPILVMLVAMYLLYPMINSERYNAIVGNAGWPIDSLVVDSLGFPLDSLVVSDSLAMDSLIVIDSIVIDSTMTEEDWLAKVDSLNRIIYTLNSRIEGLETSQEEEESEPVLSIEEEAFRDRVKSLLNLDEKEMAPILSKMTNEQLVQIYSEAGNTQREKILRSLSADRAARLITEIML
ncbi:MAG: hypothetical protein MI700_05520 [Balneolales bacterium]|nr:hypothetical protein [Balneolales bacterium]